WPDLPAILLPRELDWGLNRSNLPHIRFPRELVINGRHESDTGFWRHAPCRARALGGRDDVLHKRFHHRELGAADPRLSGPAGDFEVHARRAYSRLRTGRAHLHASRGLPDVASWLAGCRARVRGLRRLRPAHRRLNAEPLSRRACPLSFRWPGRRNGRGDERQCRGRLATAVQGGNVILARILESWRLRWRRLGWSRYPEFWPCRSRRHGHRRCGGPAADRDEAPDRRNTVASARET